MHTHFPVWIFFSAFGSTYTEIYIGSNIEIVLQYHWANDLKHFCINPESNKHTLI